MLGVATVTEDSFVGGRGLFICGTFIGAVKWLYGYSCGIHPWF